MSRSHTADSITPTLPELAEIIASGLMGDLKAKRIPKCGIDEGEAALDARNQTLTLGAFQRKQLINLTLRKLINKVG